VIENKLDLLTKTSKSSDFTKRNTQYAVTLYRNQQSREKEKERGAGGGSLLRFHRRRGWPLRGRGGRRLGGSVGRGIDLLGGSTTCEVYY